MTPLEKFKTEETDATVETEGARRLNAVAQSVGAKQPPTGALQLLKS